MELPLGSAVLRLGAASNPARPLACPPGVPFLAAVSQQRGGFRGSASIRRTGERWLARSPGHTRSRIPERLSRPVRPQDSDLMEFAFPFFFILLLV